MMYRDSAGDGVQRFHWGWCTDRDSTVGGTEISWLLSVPATCYCNSASDLLRQFCALTH